MISPLTIAGTFWSLYAVAAFATGEPFWMLNATFEGLREFAALWLLMLAVVGAINWIFEG